MKTVVVLGASYGGNRAAQILSQELPDECRLILIDRNSHFNHLYALPRFAILPEHGHKAFIPYTNIFGNTAARVEGKPRHIFLHAQVTSLKTHSLTLSRAFPELGINEQDKTLHFDYLVYALGSHLPAPINVWGPVDAEDEQEQAKVHDGTKAGGLGWLRRFRGMIERTSSVLVVGGGALGVQYATDIAEVFPQKRVTLLHSRDQLLPRFNESMHDEIMSTLSELNVNVVLGERLDLSAPPKLVVNENGVPERIARTQSGKELHAGVVLLCTGQTPNTGLLKDVLPDCVLNEGPSKNMIRVRRTLQVARPARETNTPKDAAEELCDTLTRSSVSDRPLPTGSAQPDEMEVPHPHLFAIGDAADAFGAIKAGHTAHYQAEIAARNIVKLIRAESASDEPPPQLEEYAPGEPAIKLSLGLSQAVYQVQGVVGRKTGVAQDLDAPIMWKYYGLEPTEEMMHL